MLRLDYDAVHRFVDGYPSASWDGWDVLIWKRTDTGATSPKGALRDGKWGIQQRYSPDSNGKWVLRA